MTDVIRITNGPDPYVALVYAGPTVADVMGRVETARWSPDHGAYFIHIDSLPAVEAAARFAKVHLVDQRADTDGPKPVPQECRHCAAPGSWAHPPAYCPSCGHRWDPIAPPVDQTTNRRDYRRCPACHHGNTGRGHYCTKCGNPLDEATLDLQPDDHANTPGRHHLDNPEPLADILDLPRPGA